MHKKTALFRAVFYSIEEIVVKQAGYCCHNGLNSTQVCYQTTPAPAD